MHPVLQWFRQLAEARGVRYWVDSGTLLGLMREGRLLSHDHDIDIGMWEADAHTLVESRSSLTDEEVSITTLTLDGRLYKVKLAPRAYDGMPVTIHVFRNAGEFAWAYQFHVCRLPPAPPSPHAAYRSFGVLFFRHFVSRSRILDKLIRRNVTIDRRSRTWPFRQWNWVYTWCVPGRFFMALDRDERTGLSIPRDYDEYLTYRYGDWRTPNLDWHYYRDDRSFIAAHPSVVLERIERGLDPQGAGA